MGFTTTVVRIKKYLYLSLSDNHNRKCVVFIHVFIPKGVVYISAWLCHNISIKCYIPEQSTCKVFQTFYVSTMGEKRTMIVTLQEVKSTVITVRIAAFYFA